MLCLACHPSCVASLTSLISLMKIPQLYMCNSKMSTRKGAVLFLTGFYMLLWGRRAENGVSLDWSPNGRHLLTATTAPRLRVDNGYQMYKCASSSNTFAVPPGSHFVTGQADSACMHPGCFVPNA